MSSTSYEDREKSGYMSWEFKRQRPDKIPGLQEVWRLPELPEGQTCCGEGQECFYFSCSKCASKLALDWLNPGYETSMQYIPRISCIPWPEPFKEDNKYHGEIYEMYLKYFAQMNPPMKGVAINGWGNTHAANLFHNTADTFNGTGKFEKSKDFEIDWILLNGSTITVIEVKEKSGTAKGKKKNFETKIDQIKKDRVIMQHLMEVTGTEKTRVNYVIACPNVSITEVTDGNLLRNHSQFLQDIVDAGDTISFISEECFAQRHVYKFNGDSKELDVIDFKVLTNEPTDTNNTVDPVIHPAWNERYKHLSATLILSLLIIGNEIDDENRHLYPRADNFELKQRCLRKLQSIPFDARKNFPECLVLGPDQVDIIREINRYKRGVFFICGEAGCGKSFVLLYLLYQHTAKGLTESQQKKVVFLIPGKKTEFRKFVKKFVENYCHDHLVHIREGDAADVPDCDLTLVDEIYGYSPFRGVPDLFVPKSTRKCVSSVGFSSPDLYHRSVDIFKDYGSLDENFKLFHLRKRYRNPANISMQCSNLYQTQLYYHWGDLKIKIINRNLVFTCLNDSGGVSGTADNSFKLLKFDKEETIFSHFDEISREMFSGETVLLVTDMSIVWSSSFAKEKCTHVEYCENTNNGRETIDIWSDDDWTTYLQFTGVQYHSVIFVTDRHSYVLFEESLLYQGISRATCRVIIICHEKTLGFFRELLTRDKADRQVLSRLRESKSVRLEDLQLLTEERQWEIALYFIVLTKNIENFETIKSLVIEQIGFESVADALIRSFPWGEEGEIVSMIESLNTQIQLTIHDFEDSLLDASNLLWVLPNKPKRCLLWQRLKQTLIIEARLTSFDATRLCLRWIGFSIIWHDEELYQTTTREMTSFLVACSHHLSQCFDALPRPMKTEMNCVPLTNEEEIFPEWEVVRDNLFQELQKRRTIYSLGTISEKLVIQSKLSEIYTGNNENLETFFMKIWEYLLCYDTVFHSRNVSWTKIELNIISTLDEICEQKTNETGSTHLNVALGVSRAVSDVRDEVVPRKKIGKLRKLWTRLRNTTN